MGFLGASDFGPLLGLSRFKTAHQLWLEKTGQVEPEPSGFAAELGQLLEDDVLELYGRRKGHKMNIQTKPLFQHPRLSWLRVAPDAMADGPGNRIVVEAKTAGVKKAEGWGPEGTADVPGAYFAQVQVQMAVAIACGVKVLKADMPVLFLSNRSFQVFEVPYDVEMAQTIIHRGVEFWQRVETKTWPETAEEAA